MSTKISVIILAFSVGLFAFGYFSYKKIDWIAVKQPIDVTKKENYVFSFTSQLDTYYSLTLETQKKLEFDELNCRLGIGTSLDKCSSDDEKLIIQWSISHGGERLVSGKSNESTSGFWGSQEIGKTLHEFQTIKGKEYTINAKIVETDSVLDVTSPTLVVSVISLEYKRSFVTSSLIFYTSYFFAIIAVVIWVIGFIYRKLN